LSNSSTRNLAAAGILAAVLTAGAAIGAPGEPLDYVKGVMREDTTWSGAVTITGQTVVKKGVTLTILPGTTVRFLWIDEDGDGIGDSELNVEGRIVARGKKDKGITFTSGKADPQM